jgi:hypothetical protein
MSQNQFLLCDKCFPNHDLLHPKHSQYYDYKIVFSEYIPSISPQKRSAESLSYSQEIYKKLEAFCSTMESQWARDIEEIKDRAKEFFVIYEGSEARDSIRNSFLNISFDGDFELLRHFKNYLKLGHQMEAESFSKISGFMATMLQEMLSATISKFNAMITQLNAFRPQKFRKEDLTTTFAK